MDTSAVFDQLRSELPQGKFDLPGLFRQPASLTDVSLVDGIHVPSILLQCAASLEATEACKLSLCVSCCTLKPLAAFPKRQRSATFNLRHCTACDGPGVPPQPAAGAEENSLKKARHGRRIEHFEKGPAAGAEEKTMKKSSPQAPKRKVLKKSR